MARLSEQRGDFASAMLNYQSVVKRKSVLREYALWHLAHISRTTGNLLLERNYLRQLQIFAPRSLLNDAARARLARSLFESGDFSSAILTLQNESTQASPSPADTSQQTTNFRRSRENQVLLGKSLLMSGKPDEAREIFLTLIRNLPNAAQPDDFALAAVRGLDQLDSKPENLGKFAPLLIAEEHLQRGAIYQFNRDFIAARLHYRALIERFPQNESVGIARYQIGRGFSQDGDYPRAIDAFEKLLNDDPENTIAPDAILQCASAYARLKKFNEAVSLYEQFIRRFPDSPNIERAYLNIIDARRDQGDDIEALHWAEKTRDFFKGKLPEALAVFAQARTNVSRGDFYNALANLKELEKLPDLGGTRVPGGTNKSEVLFLKAFAFEQIGAFNEAIETYFSISDGRNEFYGWRASERLRELANNDKSKPFLESRLARFRFVANQNCDRANLTACEEIRIAAQNMYRVTNEPSALELIRKAYAVLPAYREIPRADFREFGRKEILREINKPQTNSHQALADELLFLALYDEGTPELESALREKIPLVKAANSNSQSEAGANSVTAFPPDISYTLARLYNLGNMSHRAVGYAEPLWKKIPADYQIELIPRDQIELLYPIPYAEFLNKNASAKNLDPRFMLSIMRQESRFRADVKSVAAARGLMQFIPSTANQIAEQLGRKPFQQDELYDPPTAILFGSHYLANIFKEFPDQHAAVAAAYNAGEASTTRWIERAKSNSQDRYVSEIIFSQSKDYVYRVMANYRVYKILYDETLKAR